MAELKECPVCGAPVRLITHDGMSSFSIEALPIRWIQVEERLPDGIVLAANFAPGTYGYKEYIIGYVFKERPGEPGGCYVENDNEILHDVTHWMPLPEPPKEE